MACQNVDKGTARPAHSEKRGKIGKVTPRFCLSLSQFVQHFRSWYLFWKRNNRAIICHLDCDDRLRNKNFIGHIKLKFFFCLSEPALLYPSLHFGMPFSQYITYQGPQYLRIKRRCRTFKWPQMFKCLLHSVFFIRATVKYSLVWLLIFAWKRLDLAPRWLLFEESSMVK